MAMLAVVMILYRQMFSIIGISTQGLAFPTIGRANLRMSRELGPMFGSDGASPSRNTVF